MSRKKSSAAPRLLTILCSCAVFIGLLGSGSSALAQSTNLTISTADDFNISLTPVIHPTGPGANLSVATLVTRILAGGGQVAVLTYGGFEGTPDSGEPGDITINSSISYASPAGLELFLGSKGKTVVNQPITVSDTGFVTFAPLGSVAVNAALSASSGDIGFHFAARDQVTIDAPITTVGIRGIDISAQSNDGTAGTATINQPLSVTSGSGMVTVFAEQGISVAASLTVAEGYISLYSDHNSVDVANGVALSATSPNTRTAPDGGSQIFIGAGLDINLGNTGPGSIVSIIANTAPLGFQAGRNLNVSHVIAIAGAGLSAVAAGDITVDGQVTADGSPIVARAGNSFALSGVFQTAGSASASVVVDDLNPARPNFSTSAQFSNTGTLVLGPAGGVFAVTPSLTQLGSYVPPASKIGVWFGDATAIAGANYKVTVPDPPTAVSAFPGDHKAIVSFAAPLSNGGSAITAYTVTTSPGGVIATGTSSPIAVSGLNNGTPYTFTVVATNLIGDSLPSAVSAAVIPAIPVVSPVPALSSWFLLLLAGLMIGLAGLLQRLQRI